MFYILSKILGLVINPLFCILVCFTLGLVLKSSKVKRIFIYLSFILLLFFSNRVIINSIMNKWEKFEYNYYNDVHKYRYGVVLGGVVNYNSTERDFEFLRSSNRLWKALRLYNQGKIDKMIISGGKAHFFRTDTVESTLLKKYLIDIGVPAEYILTEEKSRNTYENALFSKQLISESDTVLLITSASHMYRAFKCFDKAGVHCDTFSTDFLAEDNVMNLEYLLIPSAKALVKWNMLLHEIVGVIVYKIVGYI